MTTIRILVTLCLTGVLLGLSGCAPDTSGLARTLRVGHPTLDGDLQTWPARGSLARDETAAAEATRTVEQWHTPDGARARLSTSAILWLGEVDGAVLALVAADLPGYGDSWLLQVGGRTGSLAVTRSSRYTDQGDLVYADVIPARGEGATTRYLTSTRVSRLTTGDGVEIVVTDGLSSPIAAQQCTPTPLIATRRATPTLPTEDTTVRLLDLGTGITQPRYPLVADPFGTAAKVFAQVSPCQLSSPEGPFSVARTTSITHGVPAVVAPWPIGEIRFRAPADALGDPSSDGMLQVIDWEVPTGLMSAAVWTGPGGPVMSVADRGQPLQAFTIPTAGRTLLVLTWDTGFGLEPTLPVSVTPLLRRPGLVVVPKPVTSTQVGILVPGKPTPFQRWV